MRRGLSVLLLASLALAGPLAAVEPAAAPPAGDGPVHGEPTGDLGSRLIDLATPDVVADRTLELTFTHRFLQPTQDGSGSNLWGLDSGAETGIGLAYGWRDRFELALYRTSFQETFELAGKVRLLDQAAGRPLSAALRLGVDRAERDGVADPTRPFAQILLARTFGRFTLLAAPSWVGDTPLLADAVNVPLGLAITLPRETAIKIEVVPKNRDLDASTLAWHLALEKAVGGHRFAVVLGNSRATTVDQILGGDFAGGFESGDVRLGFNLIRDF